MATKTKVPEVADVTRAMLAVFERGTLNTDQQAAIHAVRVILGDAEGTGCIHENCVHEAEDKYVCQDCRQEQPAPPANLNETDASG